MTVADASSRRRRARGGSALVGGARLVLRRLRFETGPALTIVALVAATCFLFAALPRLLNDFADDALRYALRHGPIAARSARDIETTRIAPARGADPLAQVAAHAARSQEALPAALRELVSSRAFVVRSPRYLGITAGGIIPYLTLNVQSGVEDHIRLVSGRLPRPSTERANVVDTRVPEFPRRKLVPRVEIALSTLTARELRMRVGDAAIFNPDLQDVRSEYLPVHDEQPLAVKVTGLFVLKDPQSPYWLGDRTLGTPNFTQTPDLETRSVFAQAVMAPQQYQTMLAATNPLPLEYEYRYLFEPRRVDAGRLDALRNAAAKIDARYGAAGPLERRVELGVGPELERYRGARSQAETLLAVAAIALLACALANLGLLGALSFDRRRAETGVSRTRGASSRDILFAQGAEAVLLAVPAGLLGWALAVVGIDARGSALSGRLVLTIVAGTVVLLVLAVAGLARRPLGPDERADAGLAPASPRRLALEALVAVAAVLGVYLLRRRGLDASSSGFDPYLPAVPVLLGLACGLAVLRLFPLPTSAAARLARRRRDLALHLGLSRAARRADVTSLPLLVLVLALGVATFSGVMLSTLEHGQDRTGWLGVGADLRIDAPEQQTLPASLVSRIDRHADVARAYAQEADIGVPGATPLLLAVDMRAYQRLVGGTPAGFDVPPALSKPPPIPSVVPAFVSPDWTGGGTFQITLPSQGVNFIALAHKNTFAGVPRGTPFAVVSLDALRQAVGVLEPNRLYVRHADARAVAEAVADAAPGATITSRAAVVRSIRSSPLVDSVLRGFRWAIVVAAIYAAVAIALLAVIAARSRARDLALIRTMGGSQRDTLVLAAVELAPFVLVSLVLGIGLGIAVPYLIEPGLDLGFFTRSRTNAIVVSWAAPVAFAVGAVVLVAAAVVIVGARTRRTDLARALRIGER